jgi:ABC-type sugar transport system permease subunit
MSAIAETGAAPKLQRSNRRIFLRRQFLFWALTLPAILLFSIFLLEPLINMFRVSTLDWRGLLAIYVRKRKLYSLVRGRSFFTLRNTAIHLVVVMGTVLPISFMLGFSVYSRQVTASCVRFSSCRACYPCRAGDDFCRHLSARRHREPLPALLG